MKGCEKPVAKLLVSPELGWAKAKLGMITTRPKVMAINLLNEVDIGIFLKFVKVFQIVANGVIDVNNLNLKKYQHRRTQKH